ncbi:hypothetical protein [Teichococcus aestuarii]|uniref:hypothetical protein n=1 Tax=Teichococcus aestuarii TaxID=568898 RepID=UPI003616FA74
MANDRLEIQRVGNGWMISPMRLSYLEPARATEIRVARTPEEVLEAVQGFLAAERLQAMLAAPEFTPNLAQEAPR